MYLRLLVILSLLLVHPSSATRPVAIKEGDKFNFSIRSASYLSINTTEYTDLDIKFVTRVKVLDIGYKNRTITVDERNIFGNSTKISKLDTWQFYMFFMIIAHWTYKEQIGAPQDIDFSAPEENIGDNGNDSEPESLRTLSYFITSDEKEYESFFIYDNWFIDESGLKGDLDRENKILYFADKGTVVESGTYESTDWQISMDYDFAITLDYGRSIMSKISSTWTIISQFGDAIRVQSFTFAIEEYRGILGILGGTVGLVLGGVIGILAILIYVIILLVRRYKRPRDTIS